MAAATPTAAKPAPKPGQHGGGTSVKLTMTHSAPTVHGAAQGVRAAAAQAARRPTNVSPSMARGKPTTSTPLQSATYADPFQTIMGGGTPTQQDINQYVNRTVGNQQQQQLNADLGPLRSQAGTIRNEQQTALNRWNAYTGVAQGQMADAVTAQQKGAASLANIAAQGAQQTAGLFNAQGATAANLYGGALSPTAQALLNSGRAYAGGLAANEQAFLGQGNTATQNFLRSMGDVATAEGMRGKTDIRSTYGKQLTQNQASQQALIGQSAAKSPSLKSDLREQIFNNWLSARLANVKQTAAEAATAQGWQRVKTAKGNLNERIANDQATQRIRTTTNDIAKGRLDAQTKHWAVSEKQAWQRLQNSTKPGSKATPGQKMGNLISAQLAYYNYLTNVKQTYPNPNYDKNAAAGTPNSRPTLTGPVPKSRARLMIARALSGSGGSGSALNAAQQMIDWGYVNNITLSQLRKLGVPIDPSWVGAKNAAGVTGTASAGG
jgi:hypothetical protein